MSKHTSGPWKFGHQGTEFLWIGPEHDQRVVALVPHDTDQARETSRDDARLIAAAPLMLEALQEIIKVWDEGSQAFPISMARAAIAATGGQP